MQLPVVPMAHKSQVGQVGQAAMRPVTEVMSGGPGRGTVAAWPHATLVARNQRPPCGGSRQPSRPTDIHDCGFGVKHDAGDAGIATQALNGGRGNRGGQLQIACGRARQAPDGVEGGGDLQVRPLTGFGWERPRVEAVIGELDERVGESLLP